MGGPRGLTTGPWEGEGADGAKKTWTTLTLTIIRAQARKAIHGYHSTL